MPQLSDLADDLTVEIHPLELDCEMTFIPPIIVTHDEGWTDK